jgi:predicted MFS family arabinose efflux permease
MTEATAGTLPRPAPARWPFYYGWVTLGVAAMSMVATLPGRTQGLGLVTEPLLRDLRLDRVLFAQINLVATLVGALFCLGVGRLVDRAGSRRVVTVVTAALGAVVLAMSGVQGAAALLVLVTLTRGLGQSALSASVYGLAASGIALFNEAILAERGFSPATYYRSLVVTALVALLGNFGGGALAARGAMRRLLAAALLLLTASLATLPLVTREAHVVGYAMVMGLASSWSCSSPSGAAPTAARTSGASRARPRS